MQEADDLRKKLAVLEKQAANLKKFENHQLAREKNRLAALVQNLDIKEEALTHAKQNSDILTAQLNRATADTANLSDEVMAKTVQVKQYKKQNESYKAEVEEANAKLQQTQQELERTQRVLQRLQELVKTMEDDHQDQVHC